MTDNIKQYDKDTISYDEALIELTRLASERAVWKDRARKSGADFMAIRKLLSGVEGERDQLIIEVKRQDEHILAHHQQDEKRAVEAVRMKAKFDLYSSLLSLLTDAGRVHPGMVEALDAGISALLDPAEVSESVEVKFVQGDTEGLDLLLKFIAEGAEDEDDDSDEDDEECTHPAGCGEMGCPGCGAQAPNDESINVTAVSDAEPVYIDPRDDRMRGYRASKHLNSRPIKDDPQG
jgi:hypothetical protein